jgi:hypothetical protein
MTERQWLQPAGSAASWRCIAEKLSRVALLEGPWYTVPNHSRPQNGVVEMDVDTEDQPIPLNPQNGQ